MPDVFDEISDAPKTDVFDEISEPQPRFLHGPPLRESLASKQLGDVTEPFKPLVPLGPDIHAETLPGQLLAAPYNVGKGLIEGAESPGGIALMPLGAAGKAAQALLGAGFGLPAFKEGVGRVYRGTALGEPQEAMEGALQALTGGLITAGAAHGVLDKTVKPEVPDAFDKISESDRVQAERAGDDASGTPSETGVGGGVQPAAPVEAQATGEAKTDVAVPSAVTGEPLPTGPAVSEAKGSVAAAPDQAIRTTTGSEAVSQVKGPATTAEILGMGAAKEGELTPSQQTPTGIKNATVDAERVARGLPPAIEPIKRSFGEVWDKAMSILDRDPAYLDGDRTRRGLLQELRDKPRALTDTEDALLLQRQVDLQNEYGKATRDLNQAYEDGRPEAVAAERLRVGVLSDQLLDIYNIGKKSGTETGRGLNARKMMANEDFTLAAMDRNLRAAKGGAPLSPTDQSYISDINAKNQELQKAFDDYKSSTETKLAESETRRMIAETRAKTTPTFDKRILAHAENIVSKLEDAAKPAADRLKEQLSRMSAGVDPTIIYDAAVVGSAKIARAGLDLAKFTDEMVRDFGEKIRPMIGDIWTESNKMLDKVTEKVPDRVKRIINKADLSAMKESTAKIVADKIKEDKRGEITYYVQKLARSIVEHGETDTQRLIDSVHATLQDAVPGITRREVMDAISGYGDFKQLSKDAITVTLRGMKGEMQQLAKLEDMASGQPPLKTGIERRTPTDAERKLIKAVNDAKVKFQIPVQDPSTQLKSALDTLKTTLTNRIKDYQDRLDRGDFSKRERRAVELDAPALKLKAQSEKLKKDFQRRLAQEQLKNAGPLERGADTVTKWRRGFVLSGPVTLAKLTAAAVQRMAFTPIEEAVGGVISKVIPSVAEKAPREGGFSIKAEAKAISGALTKGMVDAGKVLRSGEGDLDVLYGKAALLPPSVVDFFGHVHGALKAPTKRAEFERSLEKRTQFQLSKGIDVTDPMVQANLVIESYKDANRSIFLQDNRVVSAYKRALGALEQKDKSGNISVGGKLGATAAKVLVPIVKVPTNIVAETLQYALGSVTGSARLVNALRKGTENLKPEQADLIMRELKKGSLGAALLVLGYLNPDVIGGYYQPGEKRKETDVKSGSIQLYGVNIPSFLLHNPLLETLQIGATVRRVADSKLRKKDTENQGVAQGVMRGVLGLAEEVPFAREPLEIAKAFDPREQAQFWGELGKSVMIPQAVQSAASAMDTDAQGNPIKRHPVTATDRIKMGIPILREDVPLSGNQPGRLKGF